MLFLSLMACGSGNIEIGKMRKIASINFLQTLHFQGLYMYT
jgi:hypothetical protein